MTVKIGDRVAYSAAWLRSTGQIATVDDVGGWRGVVTALEPLGSITLATVTWFKGPIKPSRVLTLNLAKVGSPAMSAN